MLAAVIRNQRTTMNSMVGVSSVRELKLPLLLQTRRPAAVNLDSLVQAVALQP